MPERCASSDLGGWRIKRGSIAFKWDLDAMQLRALKHSDNLTAVFSLRSAHSETQTRGGCSPYGVELNGAVLVDSAEKEWWVYNDEDWSGEPQRRAISVGREPEHTPRHVAVVHVRVPHRFLRCGGNELKLSAGYVSVSVLERMTHLWVFGVEIYRTTQQEAVTRAIRERFAERAVHFTIHTVA